MAAGREAVDNAEPGEDAEPLAAGTDARDVLALIDGRHIPAKAAALRWPPGGTLDGIRLRVTAAGVRTRQCQ